VPEPRLPYVYAGHVDDQMYNELDNPRVCITYLLQEK
jgi:hypothetical protein